MDVRKDGLCSTSCLVKKKEHDWNKRPSCSVSKSNSPLNSESLETINDNSVTESTCHNGNAAEIPTKDTVLLNVEIGDKKVGKIAIKSDTLLQDLAEEFAENEPIQVAYFLNEVIKKGGENFDIIDAQVLVKLRPNWKWIPIEDLVDDQTLTLGEAFTGIPGSFEILFSLAPRVPRACPFQAGKTTESHVLCNSNHHHDNLCKKVPQEMVNNDANMTSVQEIKQLLKRIDSLLPNEHHAPWLSQHPKTIFQNQQTQTCDKMQVSTLPTSLNLLPSQTKLNHTSETGDFNSPRITTESGEATNHLQKTVEVESDVTRQINSLPEGTRINISLEQLSPKGTEPTQCFIEQLANDLPTQAFNDSIQAESCQDAHMKISEDSTATPLSRVRVQFDRNFETPLLKDWFKENPVPSKRMILNYVDELNSSKIRKGKNPVTYRAVYIWFKNTRARSLRKKSSSKTDSTQ